MIKSIRILENMIEHSICSADIIKIYFNLCKAYPDR